MRRGDGEADPAEIFPEHRGPRDLAVIDPVENVFEFPRFRWFTDRITGLVRWIVVSVRGK